jgi:hypothetical protein
MAEIKPARRRTGADLRAALAGIPAPDDRFTEDIAAAVALLESEHGAEQVSGKDLTDLFNAWLYQAGRPTIVP